MGGINMNGFNFLNKWLKKTESSDYFISPEITKESSQETLEKYKLDMGQVHINNEPFQLRGLLHLLTNNISTVLEENQHDIYYDINSDIGRYIIGDNHYIGEVLEIIVRHISEENIKSEIILKLEKTKKNKLLFEISNKKASFSTQQRKKNSEEFSKATKIVNSMNGSLSFKSNRFFGTKYIFEIPFYQDRDYKSNRNQIKKVLEGKKALFIGKNAYDTKRAQYIFKTFGIEIQNLDLSEFETKKPNMKTFDMAILRSQDLTAKHLTFFRNIYNNPSNKFKIIIVHDLFEAKEKITIAREIAHAELYNPTVIGDVEEILYQMFILESHAIEHISNINTFHIEDFKLKESSIYKKIGLTKFRGAHIAIVEDSKVDRKVIDRILSIEGVVLFHADNGKEMLDLMEMEEIDFIFTDINMPVMDGLSMTKRIRENKQWKDIPIISISSMQFEHEIKEMYFAGMNACIPKPFKESAFYVALETFLVATEKMRLRALKEKKKLVEHNNAILDIKKGVASAGSELLYKEILSETMITLQGSTQTMEDLIYDKHLFALGKFTTSTLALYENIHAPEMAHMFKELLQFLSTKQQAYLTEYVYLYQKNWKKLEEEVLRYMNGCGE
jgi:CheY-like chemotaxis protein